MGSKTFINCFFFSKRKDYLFFFKFKRVHSYRFIFVCLKYCLNMSLFQLETSVKSQYHGHVLHSLYEDQKAEVGIYKRKKVNKKQDLITCFVFSRSIAFFFFFSLNLFLFFVDGVFLTFVSNILFLFLDRQRCRKACFLLRNFFICCKVSCIYVHICIQTVLHCTVLYSNVLYGTFFVTWNNWLVVEIPLKLGIRLCIYDSFEEHPENINNY